MAQQFIGRYQLIEKIGQGGMASVYRAHDPNFKRDVAIKVLPREFLHDPTFRERFDREAQSIASLEHSAIVPVYDFGEQDGQPFLVMRYMTGGALDQRIRKGALDPKEVVNIVDRIAAALAGAHEEGIIHRDLKPANILFDQHGDAFLGDFGIVKMVGPGQAELTSSGFIGTPTYMAPEMAEQGGHLSTSVDIYALGVTVFEMLAGRKPYIGDTPVKMIMAHLNEPVPQVTDLRSDLPRAVQPVLERALAKRPENRYRSAVKFAEDLRSAFESGSAPVPNTMIEDPRSPVYGATVIESIPPQPNYQQVPVPQPPLQQGGYQPSPGYQPPPQAYRATQESQAARRPSRGGRRQSGRSGLGLGIGAVLGIFALAGLLAAAGIYFMFFNPNTAQFEGITVDLGLNPTDPVVEQENPPPDIPTDIPDPESGSSEGGDGSEPVDGGGEEPPPADTAVPEDIPTPAPPVNPVDGPGRIAFTQGEGDSAEIVSMNEEGLARRQLTNNGFYDGEPDHSPDGTLIAFESSEFGSFDIFVMDDQGQNRQRLTNSALDDRHPDWSPDGTLIAFEQGSGEQSEIMVMNADGSNIRALTSNNYGDRAPQFSPDGTQIAYMTHVNGRWEIAIMPAAGGTPEVFDCNAPDCRFPVWSPDGEKIVYNTLTSGGGAAEIYLLDPDTGAVTLVVAGIDNGRPTWNGDGSVIYFNLTRSGNTDIYQYVVGSGEITRMTIDESNDYGPDWGLIP